MELMRIADRCVSLLGEIEHGLCLSHYKFNCNDELANIIKAADNKGKVIRQYIKDKSGEDSFSTDDAAIRFVFDKDAVFRCLAFIKALAFYVLSPIVELTNKDEQLAYTESCSNDDPYKDVIIATVNRFGGPIYVKDLEDEFMRVCPDVNSIGQYLVISQAKYNDLRFPYRRQRPVDLSDFVCGDNDYSHHIRQAQAVGLITKQEAETILTSIWQVINEVNKFVDRIVEMYDKIKSVASAACSNSDLNITPESISDNSHFSVNKSYEEMQRILTALQQQRFISTNTTIETFYYRMTGNGAPVNGKIEWIKKGRNNQINVISLVDFVSIFNVPTEEALKIIPNIFIRDTQNGILLNSRTKTKARRSNVSEFHEVLIGIIGNDRE